MTIEDSTGDQMTGMVVGDKILVGALRLSPEEFVSSGLKVVDCTANERDLLIRWRLWPHSE